MCERERESQLRMAADSILTDSSSVDLQIPVDLFGSKKHPGLTGGDLGFVDSTGKIVFLVRKSSSNTKSLLDPAGNLLITIYRNQSGSWEGYRARNGEKELVFKAQRRLNKLRRTEIESCLIVDQSEVEIKLKGCPFQRSCTIYTGHSILAQTSLMYKLKQVYVGRSKFRVTIFPGSVDWHLIIGLVVTFLEGRK